MSMKQCTQCEIEKDLSEFSPKGDGKFASRCKFCLAQNRRFNYIKHPKIVSTDDTKRCSTCLETKSVNEFYRNYNCEFSFRNECKSCSNLRIDNNRKELKEIVLELKSHPCMDCRIVYPYYVMDFDHRDANDKNCNVSQMRSSTKEKLLAEIAKCDLVCANCHRIRSFNRM